MNKSISIAALVILAILSSAVLIYIGRMPQLQSYHDFVDHRMWIGIPNTLNVLSNLLFFLVGFIGLFQLFRPGKIVFNDSKEKVFYFFFFLGIFLVSFGSGYYHWNLENFSLSWDRYPVTISIMAFLAAVIAERVSLRLGRILLIPLLLLGLFSVGYWYYSELQGVGDLRFYIFVLFYPLIAIPALLLIGKAPYTEAKFLWISILCYFLAKVAEIFDYRIYEFTHQILSGHTIKHILLALGAYFVYVYLHRRSLSSRKPITDAILFNDIEK